MTGLKKNLEYLKPKQEWSEGDEYKLNFLTEMLEGLDKKKFDTGYMKKLSSWLKFLPERFNLQPKQVWSEDIIRKAVKEVGLTQHQIDWFKTNVFPPKQAWSEEDERVRKEIISIIKQYGRICEKEGDPCLELNDCLAYLEQQKEQHLISTEETELNSIAFLEQMGYTCIPPRKEQKSAEWSEEDERLLTKLMTFVDIECFDRECNGQDVIDWLKSFRPSWKPSEEQMRVLLKANPVNLMPEELSVYNSLCNDIQKLM